MEGSAETNAQTDKGDDVNVKDKCNGDDFMLRVKREHPNAMLPSRATALAAGYDLYACEPTAIPPGRRGIINTGLSIGIPSGCYGRVAPRSGLAVEKGLDVGAGVIDADYRGIVKVILFNFGSDTVSVAVGDCIAQLVLELIATPRVLEVDTLQETERGSSGFGSTGVSATY